jgi:hypothetical protein
MPATPSVSAVIERARLLIQEAEALGEPPEDPLLLFSVLYGFWSASYVAFSGDIMRELATQFLALADKRGATVPLMIGHRLMGTSLSDTGNIAEGRAHFDRAIALYDPTEHRPLATRFGQDVGVVILSRAFPLPRSPDLDHASKDRHARGLGKPESFDFLRTVRPARMIVESLTPRPADDARRQADYLTPGGRQCSGRSRIVAGEINRTGRSPASGSRTRLHAFAFACDAICSF